MIFLKFCLLLQNQNFPCIVAMEYSDGRHRRKEPVTGLAHPLLGTNRHIELGDQFHSSTDPHNSELCGYHNLDLSSSNHYKNKYSGVTIKGEVKAHEAREAVKMQEVHLRKPPNPGSNSSQSICTANSLLTTEGKEFQIQCVYCNGEHHSASCMKI